MSVNNVSSRRAFLRQTLLASLTLATLGTVGRFILPQPAQAAIIPSRTRGTAIVNVRNFGALGDGVHDDTSAFQAAVNALPATGGTIQVPAGLYLINPLRSIVMRSYTLLQLDPAAILQAKTNDAAVYRVLELDKVHDVEIAGGKIVGDRLTHTGTTGEGGHGIHVSGSSRITIRDINISMMWGDGISVGPHPVYKQHYIYSQDVVISRVVVNQARRNGLSITNVVGIKVYDSEFSQTNGTSPQCGIDIEPNQDIDGSGYCDQVWIENCIFRSNARYGINIWKRSRNVTITRCTIEKNGSVGMATRGLTGGTFTGNIIRENMKTGLYIQDGTTNVDINANAFASNYLAQGVVVRTPFTLVGTSPKVQKDIIVGKGTSDIRVGSNSYG